MIYFDYEITSQEDIVTLVCNDPWMMNVLTQAEKLNLDDWWIGAGFMRNRVWDALSNNEFAKSTDVDLVYYNKEDVSEKTDWSYDDQMNYDYSYANWEVRNQARMHYIDGFEPFSSTADGISHWVETATASAVKMIDGELHFLFYYGMDDLLNLTARPTSYFENKAMIKRFYERIEKKSWQERWPKLVIKTKS